jgi:molecular chaperone HtpG
LSDRIDEWMMGYFTEFEGKAFHSVAKGEVNLDAASDGDAEKPEADEAENDTLKKVAEVLGEDISEVRPSKRLTDSASCLVFGEQELALHMRQLLEQAGQELPDSRPVLEINLDHPLYRRLEAEEHKDGFADMAHLLHEQAVLSEGGQLKDPATFVQRMNRLMLDMESSG